LSTNVFLFRKYLLKFVLNLFQKLGMSQSQELSRVNPPPGVDANQAAISLMVFSFIILILPK